MRLNETVVVLTGGANGIGRHYGEALAGEGARLLIADLDEAAGRALAAALNERHGDGRVVSARVDVTNPADAAAMVETAVGAFGRIDVLINNVGIYPHAAFDDITYDAWRRVVTVNLDSVFLCCKAVLPQMRRQGSGKIINVVSNLVWIGLPGMAHYIAAKAGVVGLTRALARELGEDNVSVNAIAPGAVVPPIHLLDDGALARVEQIVGHQALKWCQRPADLLGPMVFLASPESDFMSGQILTVDGGLTTH